MPLSDLQKEIIQIAHSIKPDPDTDLNLKTVHEGAIFIRQQLGQWFKDLEENK